MVQIPKENPISELWEKNDQELLRELLTAGSENTSDQIRMLLHVRSLHRLSEAITSASNTGNFLAKVGIGLTIASLVLALVQFCSPRSIQLQASTQPLLQTISLGHKNGVKSCNHTLGYSPLVIAPTSSDRLLILAEKRRARCGMAALMPSLDPVLNA